MPEVPGRDQGQIHLKATLANHARHLQPNQGQDQTKNETQTAMS